MIEAVLSTPGTEHVGPSWILYSCYLGTWWRGKCVKDGKSKNHREKIGIPFRLPGDIWLVILITKPPTLTVGVVSGSTGLLPAATRERRQRPALWCSLFAECQFLFLFTLSLSVIPKFQKLQNQYFCQLLHQGLSSFDSCGDSGQTHISLRVLPLLQQDGLRVTHTPASHPSSTAGTGGHSQTISHHGRQRPSNAVHTQQNSAREPLTIGHSPRHAHSEGALCWPLCWRTMTDQTSSPKSR